MMNEILKAMETRQSVRAYRPDPIDEETLNAILRAGTFAPSGMGRQSGKIVVVQDPATREILRAKNAEVIGNPDADPFYGAPTVLVVAFDKTNVFIYPGEGRDSGIEDATIVATHMLLAAKNAGVESCWLNFFDPDKAKSVLGLPENEEVLMLMDLGYPAEGAGPLPNHSSRKSLEETVSYM